MEISIIILAYNQEKYTRKCIDSIKKNSILKNELILVDNGSTDDTYKLKDYVNVYYRLEKNLGFAKGMNIGLKKACKDFVIFLNNDTEVPYCWDEKFLNGFLCLSSNKIGLMSACYTYGKEPFVRKRENNKIIKLRKFDLRNIPSGVCLMASTDFMRSINGWSEEYGIAGYEDNDLVCKVWASNCDVYVNENVLIKHYGSKTVDSVGGFKLDKPRKIFYDKWGKYERPAILRILRQIRGWLWDKKIRF